ncbi:hypothetical protein Droror1_Dr00005385 [Drosera rotundifolia]
MVMITRSQLGTRPKRKAETPVTTMATRPSKLRPRRRKLTPKAADWASLPDGPLANIAGYLTTYDDFKTMWCVCRHWRTAKKDAVYGGTASNQVPWLMLAAENDQPNDPNDMTRNFVRMSSVGGCRYIKMKLPQVTRGVRCVSSKGWMMTAPENGPLTLFNPFSDRQINVPDINRADKDSYGKVPFLHKFVLSSSPSQNDDYWIAIIYGRFNRLAIWRPGFRAWRKIVCSSSCYLLDVIFYNGKVYAVDKLIQIFSFTPDTNANANSQTLVLVRSLKHDFYNIQINSYLVEMDGNLMLVGRGMAHDYQWTKHTTYKFWLRKLVFHNGNLICLQKVKSLGNRVLFLGDNESFFAEVSQRSECKKNCIYFTDNMWINKTPTAVSEGGCDTGVFKLSTHRVEVLYEGESTAECTTMSKTTPATWVEPRC